METNDPRRSAAGMLVFAEVVAAGGFTAAARRLGLSKASVSREVARLERRLGAQLLRRTTRSMSLTEVGETFYAGCQRVAEEAEQAERSVGELQAEPRGEIRFSAPSSLGQLQLAPRLPDFLARFPKLRVRMELADRTVDLVSERYDLAIRIAGRPADAALVQRRLCPIRFVACAAPAYLRRHGVPRAPADLVRHNCLGVGAGASPWHVPLSRPKAARLRGDLWCDNGDALRRLAVLGHGIVFLPTYLVGGDLRSGALVRILRERLGLEASAFALYPQSRQPTPKLRAFLDYLVETLGPEPPWDRYESAPARRAVSAKRARRRARRASFAAPAGA
jgi:DNA-binding transcriptional LysR family regulator